MRHFYKACLYDLASSAAWAAGLKRLHNALYRRCMAADREFVRRSTLSS